MSLGNPEIDRLLDALQEQVQALAAGGDGVRQAREKIAERLAELTQPEHLAPTEAAISPVPELKRLSDDVSLEVLPDPPDDPNGDACNTRQLDKAEIRESEGRYETILAAIDEGFCILEMIFDEKGNPVDYRFLETNPAFENQTGLTDAVGKRMRDLAPGLEKHWFETYGKVALTGEPVRFQNHAKELDRWFNVYAFRFDKPENRRVAVLFSDITGRKQTEAALQTREAELKEAQRVAHVGSWTWDTLTDKGSASDEMLRIYGFDPLTQQIPRFADQRGLWYPPEEWDRLSDVAQKAIGTGQSYELELQALRKEQRIWILARAEAVRDPAGQIIGLRGTVQDITEQKQAEEELRRLKDELEQRVTERTADLESANRALEERAARLRRLAAELTSAEQRERKRLAALLHDDLQQLLVAASMHLQNTLLRMKDDAGRQGFKEALKWIGEARNAARDLTRQLRPPVLYEASLMAALHWLATEMAERHCLKVDVQGEELHAPLNDDIKALVFEAVRELLFNTAKHAEAEEAVVRAFEKDSRLHVVVEDNGKGFDVEEAARGKARSAFGLFSIRERFAACGGNASIASAPGKGTRVALELPLVPEVLEGWQFQPEDEVSAGKVDERPPVTQCLERRIRVVVVDDHALVRQGLATVLAAHACIEVIGEASDGIEALDTCERDQPDVMLIDVNMPRMNGIEATREICQGWPGTIVVGLSVQDDEATSKAMRNAGASAFLSKAGDSTELVATILELAKESRSSSMS